MKRVYIFGIGAAVLLMLIVGIVALGLMVSPVRGQIGRAITQVFNRQPAVLAQAQTVQVEEEKGILVAGVITDSPADDAGLVRGDIILTIDGKDVNTRADLNSVLTAHQAGDAIEVVVRHGDTQKSVTITLTDVPTQQNNNRMPSREQQAGVSLGILPIGAGEMQGGSKGLMPGSANSGGQIVQVAPGSPAEKAGLKAGEVITSVDGQQIDAKNSLVSLLAGLDPGDSVQLQVQGTDGTSREISATLGENPQKEGAAYLGVSTSRGCRMGSDMGPNGFGLPFDHPDIKPGLMDHPGALIQEVSTDSPAEKAGLASGQLIVSVDGTDLSGPQTLSEAIASHKPGDQVTLGVYDPQTSQTSELRVTLGENPQKAGNAWLGISYSFIDLQQPNLPGPNDLPKPDTGGTEF